MKEAMRELSGTANEPVAKRHPAVRGDGQIGSQSGLIDGFSVIGIDDFPAVGAVDFKGKIAHHGLAEVEKIAPEFSFSGGSDVQRIKAFLRCPMASIFPVTQCNHVPDALVAVRTDALLCSNESRGKNLTFLQHGDAARLQFKPGG